MAQLKQDAAVAFANALMGFAQQLRGQKATIDDLVNLYNKEGFSAIWAAFSTAAQSANGTLGTADGTPVLTNPIDTRVAGQTNLQKAVSSTQLTNFVAALQQLQNFYNNAAVIQGDHLQNVNDLAL